MSKTVETKKNLLVNKLNEERVPIAAGIILIMAFTVQDMIRSTAPEFEDKDNLSALIQLLHDNNTNLVKIDELRKSVEFAPCNLEQEEIINKAKGEIIVNRDFIASQIVAICDTDFDLEGGRALKKDCQSIGANDIDQAGANIFVDRMIWELDKTKFSCSIVPKDNLDDGVVAWAADPAKDIEGAYGQIVLYPNFFNEGGTCANISTLTHEAAHNAFGLKHEPDV